MGYVAEGAGQADIKLDIKDQSISMPTGAGFPYPNIFTGDGPPSVISQEGDAYLQTDPTELRVFQIYHGVWVLRFVLPVALIP